MMAVLPLLECGAATLPVWENARLGRKANFAPVKIPSGHKIPERIYIVYQPRRRLNIAQSDVGAVSLT